MAIELTRKRLQGMKAVNARSVRVPPHMLAGFAVAVLAVAATSMLLGIREAHSNERAAQRRMDDAQQLLSLPSADTADLKSQLDFAKMQVTLLQSLPLAPSLDFQSDAASELLVRRAMAAGLTVKGIARANSTKTTIGGAAYDAQAIRVVVEGTPPQVSTYLADMGKTDQGMFPTLISMTVNEGGLAHAEIAFNAYSLSVIPTPAARAAATPGAKR